MAYLPVNYIAMPINADGNGPCEPNEIEFIQHEVWDQLCITQAICSSKKLAMDFVKAMNGDYYERIGK